jgi:HEAT repeat protein
VSALGKLRDGSKRAVGFECLSEIVETTSDAKLRARALRALGQTEDERASAVLSPFVKNPSALIAVVAIEAISRIAGPIEALFSALSHPEPEVVKAAMFALSETDDARVLQGLAGCLDHEAWDVRSLAAELLARIPSEAARGALQARLASEASTAVREAITRSLERMSGVRRTPPPILGGSLPPR